MTDVEQTVSQLLNRVAHIQSVLRHAVDLMLERPPKQPETGERRVSMYEVERNAHHWQFLVPEAPADKARIAHKLLTEFPFSPTAFPQTAAALSLAQEAVQQAYEAEYGAPLTAQYAETVPPEEQTDTEAARDLLEEIDWLPVRRGATLYTQGDGGEYLYGVVDGRLRVSIANTTGDVDSVQVYSGSMVGEEALANDIPYGATVTALRDSDLIRLHREGFERLVAKYPRGMMQLAYQMMQRGQQIQGLVPTSPEPQSVVVLHVTPGTGEFSPKLADVLGKYQSLDARVVTPSRLDDVMSSALRERLEEQVDDYAFVDWLQSLQAQHDMLLFEGDLDFPNWTRRVIEQADHVLVVGRVGEQFDFAPWQAIMEQISHPELQPLRELVVLHETRRPGPYGIREWIEQVGRPRHHHVALDSNAGFERVARFLLGKAVGVVFGGGGMRGACHHGVIQALNEAGIQADVVGGTSAGSIVAAQYALGWTVEEMFERTKQELMQKDVLVNLTFPIVAFNTGQKVTEVYQQWFGEVMTEDLWTTCFTVSANMTLTYQSTNQYGPLWRNVRYSTSIAGLFPPVPDENGHLHIDGGVYDNTPSDVMRGLVGAGTVIASDLGYTERKPEQFSYGTALNGWRVLWSRVNPFSPPVKVVAITDVLMQSNALAARSATRAQVAPSDLIINPGVPDIGLFDFGAADDLYKAGYDTATDALDGFQLR